MYRPYLHHNKTKDGQRKVSPPGPSYMSDNQVGSPAGRPLVQEPRMVPVRKNVSPTRVFSRPSPPSPNTAYRESYRRRFEREEAQSLRNALQEMDIQDDIRLHQAAQDEATELVWMHQNPGLPFKNPYAPYRNPDMERSSQGSDRSSVLIGHTPASRSPQGDSYRPRSDYYTDSPSKRAEEQQPASGEPNSSPRKNGTLRKNLKVDFSLPQNGSPSKRTSSGYGLGLGSISNGPSKGVFRNPNDHIYEEPAESQHMDDERPDFSRSDSSALKVKPRNAVPRGSRPLSGRFGSLSFVDKLSRFELHKHPPTQSRNPEYKANDPLPQANPNDEQAIPKKDGIEIRSDEIRAATSKKLKDRSTRLPMPTAVSDRAGRPIVSFDPTWKPTEAQSPGKGIDVGTRESASPTPPPAPAAPTIEISEAPSIPVINLPDDKPPTLSEMAGSSQDRKKDESSLPTSPSSSKRSNPFQRKSPSSALQNRWLSTYSRAGVPTATCESCALPISGKIVTAAGSRFHPECFMCHHCQTPLECVAFYQEPDAKRQERLAAVSEADEEARLLRFYCHLDFHEMFSPRCKSCKTPIEGEVVVACGAEWHVGHFFCAECGDKRMVLHGVFNAIPGALLLDARGAKNQYLMMLSSQLSEVSGMMSALSVTNVVLGLGRTADILSEKANRKEQQKAASSEAQSSYLYAKGARAYDLRRHLGFDNDCTRNAEKTRFII
ncbi:hypothetical protein APSETT444_010124 [Aspergillus pseudonomiae]